MAITISPSRTHCWGELGGEGFEELGEVAIEGLLVAALDEDFVVVAEDEGAEAVPFGFKEPVVPGGQVADALGEHGEDGRVDG